MPSRPVPAGLGITSLVDPLYDHPFYSAGWLTLFTTFQGKTLKFSSIQKSRYSRCSVILFGTLKVSEGPTRPRPDLGIV
ncbi:hypothetical protein J6590_016947 [Homalodisca vitripennis]|nr:hypothetical protein J6590_016947 [Homalodisca vitripennis]